MTEAGASAPAQRRRILVAIDPARVRAAPIATAALLARQLDLELIAVVVEEQAWLRAAALPFARELRLASGQWQAFDLHQVERLFREHARRVEDTLARVCAEQPTRYTVTVARGSYPRQAIESAGSADWLVLDRDRAGDRGTDYHRIAVAFDGTPAGQRVLATAAAMARDTKRPLRVLLLAEDDPRASSLREQARAIAGDGLPLEFERSRPTDAAAVLARLAAGGHALLVIDSVHADPAALAQPALAGSTIVLTR